MTLNHDVLSKEKGKTICMCTFLKIIILKENSSKAAMFSKPKLFEQEDEEIKQKNKMRRYF